ncbi:Uncharacterized protein dnm_100590 [Desulfonema magnum]|uniref:Uncharacterized protein n=1 Tax=Desulfonema magnum TaxID=45655 RepID=A0A975BYY7_9BACT|nr:Uncharacterized protein dnm_100590 [Desulfonema magnum]
MFFSCVNAYFSEKAKIPPSGSISALPLIMRGNTVVKNTGKRDKKGKEIFLFLSPFLVLLFFCGSDPASTPASPIYTD